MRAILFDLDGTLLDFDPGYDEVLHRTFRTVEGTTSEEWVETYTEGFFDLFETHDPEPFRSAFARIDGVEDPGTLSAALLEHEIEMSRPAADVHEDLERLGSTFRLGVLTNGIPDWQRRKLEAHDLDQFFDAFVASYEVGAHKPKADMFRTAERRLEADAYAMVGDSDADVDGARKAGWAAHRYDGDGFGDLPSVLEW